MGHAMGMRVIASGVESQAQLDCLQQHGCDEVLGLLISEPLGTVNLLNSLDSVAMHACDVLHLDPVQRQRKSA